MTNVSVEQLKEDYSRELAAYTRRQWDAVRPSQQKKDSEDGSGASSASITPDELAHVRTSGKQAPPSHTAHGE